MIEKAKKQTLLVALGGNALIRKGEEGTVEQQFNNLSVPIRQIAKLSQNYKAMYIGSAVLAGLGLIPGMPTVPFFILSAGLGGAAFPTHVKLRIPEGKSVDTLILNGAECEPYLTTDHRVMLEQTADVLEGIRYLKKATSAARRIFSVARASHVLRGGFEALCVLDHRHAKCNC